MSYSTQYTQSSNFTLRNKYNIQHMQSRCTNSDRSANASVQTQKITTVIYKTIYDITSMPTCKSYA